MKRDKHRAESSYEFEATFAAGSIGINLQTTRSGFGTYVDSFHRSADNSLLPAELCGYIKLGDVLLEINGDDVSQLSLTDIPKVLGAAKRPVCMKFERAVMNLTFADTVRDPRKLPWLMQYFVDSSGIEAAITDQAKIYLWLECDQYVHNYNVLSGKDSCDHAIQIVKKFFTEGSTFSLLEQASRHVRQKVEYLFSSMESLGPGPLNTHLHRFEHKNDNFLRLFRDCQLWVEQDMNHFNFKKFISSPAASRMTGYLVYSPPFEKMTLFDILRCDRRTMYMLAFLSQIKRHTTLFCYNMLRDETSLEESLDGITAEDIRDLLEKGFVCAHILGIAESSAGAEDLPMIARLKEYISVADSEKAFKGCPVTVFEAKSRNVMSPLSFLGGRAERADGDVSQPQNGPHDSQDFLVPCIETVNCIRECLIALRNSMLRELVQDLSPKFFASKEFEILLWELNERQEQGPTPNSALRVDARRTSIDFDDDDSVGSGSDVRSSESVGVVPNGAVQRLLRKMTMPEDMTMHRAPLELLEEIRYSRSAARGAQTANPFCWLSSFDTDFSALSPDDVAKFGSKKVIGPKLIMETPVGIFARGCEAGDRPIESVVPQSIVEFFVPSGKIIWEENCDNTTFSNQNSSKTIPSPKVFNFTISGGSEVGLLYVAAIVFNRRLDHCEQNKWESIVAKISAFESAPSPMSNLRSPNLTPGPDFLHIQTPGETTPAPVASVKVKESSSDDNLSIKAGLSPFIGNSASPKDGNSNTALNNLKGKVDKLTSSPFFDKFKGITPPALFRAPAAMSSPIAENTVKSCVDQGQNSVLTPVPQNANNDLPSIGGKGADITPSGEQTGQFVPPISLNNHYGDESGIDPITPCNGVAVQQVDVCTNKHTSSSRDGGVGADGFIHDKIRLNYTNSSFIEEPQFPKRYASCGFCLVTKYPTIDTLRRPLYDILTSCFNGKDNALSSLTEGIDEVPDLRPAELVKYGHSVDAFEDLWKYVSKANQNDPEILRSGGATDFDPNSILCGINPKNVVALYFALLLEQKIAVISSKLTALTCLGEFLREALTPFHWNHVYVPVLPKKMSGQILECPTPFFVGIQREFFDAKAVPADVCVLDLDHDACRMSPELTKALKSGRRIIRALDNILRPGFVSCDELYPPAFRVAPSHNGGTPASVEIAEKMLNVLKSFSWEILLGIHECGMSSVDHDEVVVLFDEAMFLAFKRRRAVCSLLPADDTFLKPLLRTQAFSVAATTVVLKRLGEGSRPCSRGSSPYITVRNRSLSGADSSLAVEGSNVTNGGYLPT